MDLIQEIERAIDSPTPQQIDKLYCWLDRHQPPAIDEQPGMDLEAGRFDDRIHRALADDKAGDTLAGNLLCQSHPILSKLTALT